MIKIDLTKCTGCKQCETTCSFFRTGKTSNHLSRIKVLNLYSIGIDGPVVCQQCSERYCVNSCPVDALTIGNLGQIIVSPTICTLCGACEKSCPIGAIEIYDEIAYVCDLCGGNPRCIEVCTEKAISYNQDIISEISLKIFKEQSRKMNPSEKRNNFLQGMGSKVQKIGGILMLKYGYGGRILRINLSTKSFRIESLDQKWMKNVIGGRAANTKRLFEELDHACDPLSPENMLIFGIGPLTGSILPSSSYTIVTAKSPLTGILGDSAAGGQFGAEMKLAGFDQIIITGKSAELSYIYITNNSIEIIKSLELKYRNIIDTTDFIRQKHRSYETQVAAIGPAGENMVLYSTIVSSGNRVNGRTGMGAVMGSKNLKAIAIRGNGVIRYADPLKLYEEIQNIKKLIFNHGEYQKRYNLGTTMLMNDLNGIGILPTKHFQEGICGYVDEISGETLAKRYKVKNKACFNCNLHCSRYYITDKCEAEGPEYETLCSFTSKIGSNDLPFALEMNHWLNQMGLDCISTSEIIAWIMECQEKGLISVDDIGGITLKWGDVDSVRKVVEMITFREGIGDALANGATKFSKKFSNEAQKLVLQVKGLDIINGDPRGIKAYGLTYAIASRGGDHLRAEPFFELTGRFDEALKRFGTKKAADRLAEEGKAALVFYSEKIALLTDSLTVCKNIGLCMDVLTFEIASNLIKYSTGISYSPDRIQTIMNESMDLQHKINQKFGLTKADDNLPERFLTEKLPTGPTKDSTVDIDKMVDEYYKLHNWEE